jgi:hypothetical protein
MTSQGARARSYVDKKHNLVGAQTPSDRTRLDSSKTSVIFLSLEPRTEPQRDALNSHEYRLGRGLFAPHAVEKWR